MKSTGKGLPQNKGSQSSSFDFVGKFRDFRLLDVSTYIRLEALSENWFALELKLDIPKVLSAYVLEPVRLNL